MSGQGYFQRLVATLATIEGADHYCSNESPLGTEADRRWYFRDKTFCGVNGELLAVTYMENQILAAGLSLPK